MNATEFYDRLAQVFDVMTDWQARLAFEMPFIQRVVGTDRRSILDTACGTGWHALALAQKGYTVTGCDGSPAMIERARANAAQVQANAHFAVADFSQLDKFETFDAVLCLGNSLPHLLSQAALVKALTQMRARLTPGGIVILHNLNYDLRVRTQPRFFAATGNADTLVWRFADYADDGTQITFHTALFERSANGWSVQVNSTPQRPLLKRDLDDALTQTGFINIQHFGGLDGSPFDPEKSGDLVIVAWGPV
jgi:SAM-dependent methyltransferase